MPPLKADLMFGAAVPDLPGGRVGLPALESILGAKLRIAAAFVDWSYVPGGENEMWLADGGTRDVLLSWEPNGIRFTDVSRGAQDGYLERVVSAMRRYPYPLFVRPWPEMNANWSAWQPTADGGKPSGGTPAQFVDAWRYLVTFFRQRGVLNLKFVFNPDASDWPANTRIAAIWPGPSYIDVLGIDGYNWGNGTAGNTWRTFGAVFANMYGILTALDSAHPVWITETGCKEPQQEDSGRYPAESSPVDLGNSKGVWIRQMMSSRQFPQVTAIVWFNKRKERDWRLESSRDSLGAIRACLGVGRASQGLLPTSGPRVVLKDHPSAASGAACQQYAPR